MGDQLASGVFRSFVRSHTPSFLLPLGLGGLPCARLVLLDERPPLPPPPLWALPGARWLMEADMLLLLGGGVVGCEGMGGACARRLTGRARASSLDRDTVLPGVRGADERSGVLDRLWLWLPWLPYDELTRVGKRSVRRRCAPEDDEEDDGANPPEEAPSAESATRTGGERGSVSPGTGRGRRRKEKRDRKETTDEGNGRRGKEKEVLFGEWEWCFSFFSSS